MYRLLALKGGLRLAWKLNRSMLTDVSLIASNASQGLCSSSVSSWCVVLCSELCF